MLKMFDFECATCSKVFEELVTDPKIDLPCTADGCTGKAKRLIGAPRIDYMRMGLDPGFPGAWEKWAKTKKQHHLTDKGTMHKGKAPNLLMY